MAFATPEAFQEIIVRLSVLRYVITSNTKRGKFDIATDAEDFFAGFINLLLGWNLKNLNITEYANYPAIDLADQDNRISIQVTTQNSLSKIRETIELFHKHKHQQKYDHLIVLILSRKLEHKTEIESLRGDIKKIDIWDIDDLLAIVEYFFYHNDYFHQDGNLYEQLENYTRRQLPSIVRNLSIYENTNGNSRHGLLHGLEIVIGHPPKSARRFLDFCFKGYSSEDQAAIFNEVNSLYHRLKDESHIGSRQIVSHAIRYSITGKEFTLRFPNYHGGYLGEQSLIFFPANISQSMPYKSNLKYCEKVAGLRFLGWSEPLDDWPNCLSLKLYLPTYESNLFYLLKLFFQSDVEKLNSVLVDLDFRHLD
jgi:hypothetical protein